MKKITVTAKGCVIENFIGLENKLSEIFKGKTYIDYIKPENKIYVEEIGEFSIPESIEEFYLDETIDNQDDDFLDHIPINVYIIVRYIYTCLFLYIDIELNRQMTLKELSKFYDVKNKKQFIKNASTSLEELGNDVDKVLLNKAFIILVKDWENKSDKKG